MTKASLEKLPDGTIKLTVSLPFAQVSKIRDEVLTEHVKEVNVPGFRKGKAPKDMAAGRLNPDHIREDVLKKLLPEAYMKAVQENAIRPIMNPKISVEKIDEGEDWVFSAMTCEMPEITPGKYKTNVQKVTKKATIIVPGKEEKKAEKPTMEQIIKAVLEDTKATIPAVLVEQEADRLLAQLLDDIKRLGLSLDQYLASTKRTSEDLRAEYAKRAEEDIKVEFVLQKIADLEKISVEEKEIEEAIQKAQSPAEKQNLESNRYVIAGILRQQKTLDFLMNL
ncbi:MAG: trigger factor [Patescibacteria group bacterium]